jgi:hypothetical protein
LQGRLQLASHFVIRKHARLIVAGILLAGILAVPAFLMPSDTPDWPAFYVGARLVGTPDLYSFDASNRITREFMPAHWVWAFLRPPSYAAMLSPLRLLSPAEAFLAWQALSLAGIACAAFLVWRSPLAVPLVVLFHPLWSALRQGQDIWFVVGCLAGSMFLLETRRPLAAGALLALGTVKPHLFLLIPVAILALRAWRFGAGAAVTGALLAAISTVLQGPRWVADFWRAAAENQARITGSWSFASTLPGPAWTVVAVLAIVIALYLACRRLEPGAALALAAVAGLLTAPRLYAYDTCVALPLLLLWFRSRSAVRAPRGIRVSRSQPGPILKRSREMCGFPVPAPNGKFGLHSSTSLQGEN